MNKKGVLGLDTVKGVMLLLLVVAIVGVSIILTTTNLTNVADQINKVSGTIYNETLTTVTEEGEDLSVASNRDCSATIITVTNATGGEIISS